MPGLKLLPPWTGSGAVTSHFEGMEVELTAMQAAAAHPGGHPTQGAASPQFGGRIPRQQLFPLPPSAGTGRGTGASPAPKPARRAEIALQLHSASLVVPQQIKSSSHTTSTSYPRHCGQASPTPPNCLLLMHLLNPFMVINRF